MRFAPWFSWLLFGACAHAELITPISAAPAVQLVAAGGPSNSLREGAILLSTDNGSNWKEVWYSDAPNARVRRVRYFPKAKRFVAAGNFGVMHSTDGENWTLANAGNGGFRPMNDVAYGAGMFVAVGPRGGVLYSHDGESWKHIFYHPNGRLNLPAMKDWEQKMNSRVSESEFRGVAFAGGYFIATGTYERALAFMVDVAGVPTIAQDRRNAKSSLNRSIGIISDDKQNVLVYGSYRHWFSSDAGKTFRRVRDIKKVVVLDATRIGSYFYLGGDSSILVKVDTDGKNWERKKLKGYSLFSNAVSQVNGVLIAAPPRPNLIHLSPDQGATWVEAHAKFKTPEGYKLSINSIAGRVVSP